MQQKKYYFFLTNLQRAAKRAAHSMAGFSWPWAGMGKMLDGIIVVQFTNLNGLNYEDEYP
jgi:hypothetical protein